MFSPDPTQYISDMPVARYRLFVLKVPLNTNKPNTTFVDLSKSQLR